MNRNEIERLLFFYCFYYKLDNFQINITNTYEIYVKSSKQPHLNSRLNFRFRKNTTKK